MFSQVEEKIKQYPYLNRDLKCDVLIVGGGIDGAIANYYLSKKYNVAIVEKSRFGRLCTSCVTVLLEYQLDDYAEDLLPYMTEEEIVAAYKMGLESIEKIDKFIKENGNECNFSKLPSLMYTNNIFGVNAIKKEHYFRIKHNFKSELFTEENNPFPFKIKAGLFNEDGGAEFNPYLFTKQMIESAVNQNAIFENTEISDIKETSNRLLVITNIGDKITCKKIILATGFDFSLMKDKNLCQRVVYYSIVTNPISNFSLKKGSYSR